MALPGAQIPSGGISADLGRCARYTDDLLSLQLMIPSGPGSGNQQGMPWAHITATAMHPIWKMIASLKGTKQCDCCMCSTVGSRLLVSRALIVSPANTACRTAATCVTYPRTVAGCVSRAAPTCTADHQQAGIEQDSTHQTLIIGISVMLQRYCLNSDG